LGQYGFLPGVTQVLLVVGELAAHLGAIHKHLQFRADSPLTRLQREMLATVDNGLIGGAP
jgi:hypothetical protein